MKNRTEKWKRLLAFVVACSMTLSMLTVSAFAAGDVAIVTSPEGEVIGSYTALNEAVKVADDGDTITLLQSTSISDLYLRRSLILALGGYALTVSGSIQITGYNQEVTIKSGTLGGESSSLISMMNGTLDLVDLESADGAKFSLDLRGGQVNIQNCRLTSANSSSPLIYVNGTASVTIGRDSMLVAKENSSNGVIYVGGGTLTVNDAKVYSEAGLGIQITNSSGTVILDAGSVVETGNSGDVPAIKATAGKVQIKEGASLVTASGGYPVSPEDAVELPSGYNGLVWENGEYILSSCSHNGWNESMMRVEPTCETEGKLIRTCADCGTEVTVSTIDALGHDWENGTVTEATCTEAGSRTCGRAGCQVTQPIPALDHDWGEWTGEAADCVTSGTRSHTCKREGCGVTETDVVEAPGHTEVTDEAIPATCGTAGKTEGKHCSVCGEILEAQREVPATGNHRPVTEWSSDGTDHWHVCGDCGAELGKAAHTENAGVVTTLATSTANGTRTYSCTECGRVLRTETIPATGTGTTNTGNNTGDSTGGNLGGNTGSGTQGGPGISGGPTGGDNTGDENLTDPNTPLGEEPDDGEEEDLTDGDTPLISKPFLFTDVGENRWFYTAIKYVYDRDLMGGVQETLFDPNLNTTRSMLVTVLYRLDGAESRGEVSNSDIQFTDVPAGKWYTDQILWAAERGIVTGYDSGAFGPNDIVTRQQVATILYRYAAYRGCDMSALGDLSAYADVNSVAGYAKEAMAWAVGTGIIGGVNANTLDPKGSATRAQIATMLMRFDQFLVESLAEADETEPEDQTAVG